MIKNESTLSSIIMINPTTITTSTTFKSRHKSRSVNHHRHHRHHHHHETSRKMSFLATNLVNLSLLMCSTLFWCHFSIVATANEQFDYTKLNLNIVANNTIHPISALSPYKNNVTFSSLLFTDQSNTDLIRLALDNDFNTTGKERKKLYVGAQNYLHRVALRVGGPRDFFLLEDSVRIPLRNTQECATEVGDLPAEPRTNDLKVVFQVKTGVFACGTDDCGRCYAYKQDDFSITSRLSHQAGFEDPVDFIVSRKSMVFFPGEYNTGKTFFVGVEPDGRAHNSTTPFFSARAIEKSSAWQYTSKQSGYKSRLNLYEDYRQTYPIKFVYGFTHNRFAYLLTLQPADINKYNDSSLAPKYETRLSRICVNDSYFNSYIEIPLMCRSAAEHDHYLARTATISQYISSSSNNTEEDALYVSFDGVPSPSSAICAFPMKDIERQFEFVARNCYDNGYEAQLMQSIRGPHEKLNCLSSDGFIETDKIVCGSEHYNRYLRGIKPLDGKHVFSLTNDYVTSLGAVNYGITSRRKRSTNHFTFLFAGTEQSRLMKLHLFNQYQLRSIKYFTQLDSAVGAFLPNPVYEPHSGNFYALTQRSLMQIPVKACSVYVSCAACLRIDQVGCFWYKDKCMHTDDVPEDARNEVCPPELYNFSPKEGPPQGGTLLTLYGNNFGRGTVGDKNDYANVTVNNITCEVTKRTQNIIECKIERDFNQTYLIPKDGIKVGAVDGKYAINLDETSKDFLGYNIAGSVVMTRELFAFTKVTYKGIHPWYGPFVGGTKVAIWGENLHIGTELLVKLGHANCRVLKRTRKFAICDSGPYQPAVNKYNTSKAYSEQVNFILDGNDFVLNSDNKLAGDGTHIFSPEHEISVRRRKKRQSRTAQTVQHPFERSIEFFEYVLMNHVKKLEFGESYTYKPVPQITDIRDRECGGLDSRVEGSIHGSGKFHSIESGGTDLWFEGDNLNSIKYPLLDVLVNGKPLNNGTLCNVTHSTIIRCTIPPLKRQLSVEKVEARYVLHLDGFQVDSQMPPKHSNLSRPQLPISKLYYYPDPKITNISSSTIKANDLLITIQGFNLNRDLPYQISLNNTIPCLVNNDSPGTDKLIKCKVNISPEMLDAVLGEKLDLQARVGNITKNLGQVTIQDETKLSTVSIVFIVLAVLVLIGLIGFVPYRVYKSNQRDNKKEYNPIQMEPIHKSLSEYFHEAYGNYDLYNTLKEGGFIIEDPNLVVHIHEVRLGSGHFGNVHRGKYRDDDVAVKTLKRRETIDYVDQLQGFFMEADTMKEFNHRNVLSLIGITMDMKPIDGPSAPAILLPFMSFGDLLSYVRNENNHPNVQTLIDFSIQIAEGMDYLSKLNFVHRDLAARNCLIGLFNQQLVVKVSDFGLSRHFNQAKLYYRVNQDKELPYRWMPIELLDGSNIVTTKSDVWSFGVVMWELITRGHVPYGQLNFNEVRDHLKRGDRLTQFEFCPDLIYSIMMECWYEKPEDRPTFENVLNMISDALTFLQTETLPNYVNLDPNATHVFRACPINYNVPDIKNQVSNYRSLMMEKAVHQFSNAGFSGQGESESPPLNDSLENYEEDYRLYPPPSYTAATQMPSIDTLTTTTAYPGQASSSNTHFLDSPRNYMNNEHPHERPMPNGHGPQQQGMPVQDYSMFSNMSTLPR